MDKPVKYLKPTQFAELEVLKAIVYKRWSAGQKLPPERELALQLGITRPTLREVLQRLSRDGWIKITHGRPTIVNDYNKNGGLGILNSLLIFDELTSSKLIQDWLEFRTILFPELAYKAIISHPNEIIDFLNKAPNINTSSKDLVAYDWDLQLLLIKHNGNSIANMLYNDLSKLYHKHCLIYFDNKQAKTSSINYYNKLKAAIIGRNENVKAIIKTVMEESANLWSKSSL